MEYPNPSTIFGMLSFGGNDTGRDKENSCLISPSSSPASPPPLDLAADAGGLGLFQDYERRVVYGAISADRRKLLNTLRNKHFEMHQREMRARNICTQTEMSFQLITMTNEEFITCCNLNREIGGLLRTLEAMDMMLERYDVSFYNMRHKRDEPPHDIYDVHASNASVYAPPYSKSAPSQIPAPTSEVNKK